MAVPKKRTGSSAQNHRRANWKATKPEITKCKNCGEMALTHTVCTACGYYKGKAVSIKSPDYVETPLKQKKKAEKPAAKAKTKKQPEAKAEEVKEKETIVEEVKTEETAEIEAVKPETAEKTEAETSEE